MPQYYLANREGLAEAIRLAHRALELDPRFGLVAGLAGVCHGFNVLWGYAADPQFECKEAIRLRRLALSFDDDDPETLAWAATISAYMVGDCETAIELADRAVALNPNSYLAWGTRGWVYRVAGQSEEAVLSFERAIRMSPKDPLQHRVFVRMGYAFVELSRFDEAIVAAKKALRQNPSYWVAYRCLASALGHLGRDAEAREAVARLLELDPAISVSEWIARGGQSNAKLMIEGLRKAGLPEEAIRSFERAIRVSPVDPLQYNMLTGMGYAFIELGRFDEAIVAGKKGQRQNPSYSGAYRCLASAFAHLGREAEAREAAACLLEVDPAFTISSWIARGGQSNAKLLIEGLRKAGLPK